MSNDRRSPTEGPARRALDPAAMSQIADGGMPIGVLQALGLVSDRGGASADAARKIKQIEHFVRLLAPGLDDVFARHPEPIIVDAAAGRAALGFVLYHRYIAKFGRGRLVTIESRPELVEATRQRAAALGWDRIDVIESRIAEATLPPRAHFVLALHACDTATDDALLRALEVSADHVALVPCCQAEVAQLLREAPARPAERALWRHAWHRREFGAHLTNVIRALVLQANGYQVTVTELAGWEHSLKNELILGRRVARYQKEAADELRALLADIPVRPSLIDRLNDDFQPAVGSTSSSNGGIPSPTEA